MNPTKSELENLIKSYMSLSQILDEGHFPGYLAQDVFNAKRWIQLSLTAMKKTLGDMTDEPKENVSEAEKKASSTESTGTSETPKND